MFFKENLPRLKYWNPATPMIVNRHSDNAIPPTMTIYLRDEDNHARYDDSTAGPDKANTSTLSSAWDGSAKAPLPAEDERTVTIEMRNQHSSVILKEFMEKTRAVPVFPTPQEQTELDEIEDLRQRGEVDRERLRKLREAQKREEALMNQARSEAAAFKASTA
jgi:large subunit ribosomal protein MRP49